MSVEIHPHQDVTANLERTREELRHIGLSFAEVDSVIDGYPELNARLWVPDGEAQPFQTTERRLQGREVTIIRLPAGYDATNSSYRASTLSNQAVVNEFLFGPADRDSPTGGDWSLSEHAPAVTRALADGCRDFTQHLQPLVPGWRQLLSLRAPDGSPLGMPTGIGWYTHLWLSPMCDAATFRLSKARDDLEVLLYQRRPDPQSEKVWATPGGFVVLGDAAHEANPGATARVSRWAAASARRTLYWAEVDVSQHPGVPLRPKIPVSSGNTLSGGLKTVPYARFVHRPNYQQDPTITGPTERGAGWVSVRALLAANPEAGVSGKEHDPNSLPIWTTHFEYVVNGIAAMASTQNQARFRLNDQKFTAVLEVVQSLRQAFPHIPAATT